MTTTRLTETTPAAVGGPAEAGAWWFLDTLVVQHRLADVPDEGSGPVVLEVTLPVGASPPLHVDPHGADSFFLLAGRMALRCGEQTRVVGPGDWVSVPAGTPHTFRVLDGPARMLGVHADDGFLRLVRALGEPAPVRRLPVPTGGPGIEELSRVMATHGVTTVGPSMTEQQAREVLARCASPDRAPAREVQPPT
jgi:quercetin dioxygenase-like cupin family protein